MAYTIKRWNISGCYEFDLDSQSIQASIDEGLDEEITSEYVMHRINFESGDPVQIYRLATCSTMAAFKEFAGAFMWTTCRQVVTDALTAGEGITQADYDLVDGILPTEE